MKTLAQNLLLLLFATFTTSSLFAQFGECDSLVIESVRYAPFNESEIVVQVTNNDPNTFWDFPLFFIEDGNGTYLAGEIEQEQFAIFGTQEHYLDVSGGVTLQNSFVGTLQLFANGSFTPVCTFNRPFSLCPPTNNCVDVTATVFSFGGGGGPGGGTDYFYEVTDANGNVVDSGEIIVQGGGGGGGGFPSGQAEICLEPGDYSIAFTSTGGANDFAFIEVGSEYPGETFQEELGPDGLTLELTLFGNCVPDTTGNTSVQAVVPPTAVQASMMNEVVVVNDRSGQALGQLRLFDAAGRLVQQTQAVAATATLNMASSAAGLYVLVQTVNGKSQSFKLVR